MKRYLVQIRAGTKLEQPSRPGQEILLFDWEGSAITHALDKNLSIIINGVPYHIHRNQVKIIKEL